MPMLALFPWLHLREPVREGQFHLFPHAVGDALPVGVESLVSAETMGRVLSQYRSSANLPLPVVPVLQYENLPLGAALDEGARAAIFRFAQHLAISGLSDRRFTGGFPDGYTASGHYQVVIQVFPEPYSGGVSLTHRRKDGHASVMLGQSDVHFVRPTHLVRQGEPNFNLRLLTALQATRSLPPRVHEHIDASIVQFLLANSDSPDVPLDAESIATYAALERVSDSTQTLNDIRSKLPALLSLVDGSPWTARIRDELGLPAGADRTVLHAWLKQLYVLRGNVAHGKPAHWAPQQWSQQEHLVAGAFIYPLALKCLLAKHELYSLALEDVGWALGLEKLLQGRPFFEVPPQPVVEEGGDKVTPPARAMRDGLRRVMTRWQRQFDDINYVLLGIELSENFRDTS